MQSGHNEQTINMPTLHRNTISFALREQNILTLSCSAQLLVILSEFSNQLSSHQFNLGIWRQEVTAAAFIQDHI